MTGTRLSCASASNSRGRPLAAKTLGIREAVLALTAEQKVMTVRGIFYALESRGVVPKDEKAGYRPVQTQVLKMRREGLLPWDFISDGTRWMRKPTSYKCLDDAITVVKRTYRRDLWQAQDVRVEVWLEKDALAGIVREATEPWDVPLMISRGTSSATFLHAAAQQAAEASHYGIATYIFTLYDFDAAGERAARAVEKGLSEYAPEADIYVERLAITEQQIAWWNLPTRPAKKSDPEAHKFGSEAVELDAIPPDKLIALVEDAVVSLIDGDAWEKQQTVEESEREILRRMVAA